MPAKATSALSKIENFVVLMLENRSFDHMLGFLYADTNNVSPSGAPFDGLTGKESNPDANGKPVKVYRIQASDPYPYFMPGADPGEGYSNTNQQLFGTKNPAPGATPTNQGFIADFASAIEWEQTQKSYTIYKGTTPSNIMGMFTPELLPVMSTLARAYAVSDRWFSSVPTETFPNRAFMQMATSQGQMNDDSSNFTAKCIYEQLGSKATWAVYGYTELPLTAGSVQYLKNLGSVPNIGVYSDFAKAAKAGTLANYIFLEPSWGSTSNSQHPVDDVSLGEQLVAQVYETLRTSPQWNKTLLIILFDEHGGCYDHVPPPSNATPPDNSTGEYGFDFKRFGVRVPAVLVSPWIAPGTVLRPPAGGPPFDHTSVLKTVEKRFGVPPLTARDAAAPDLGAVLTLRAPRTDNPLAKVKPPASTPAKASRKNAPTHLQIAHARIASRMPVNGEQKQRHVEDLPQFKTGDEAVKWADQRHRQFRKESTKKRKPSGKP